MRVFGLMMVAFALSGCGGGGGGGVVSLTAAEPGETFNDEDRSFRLRGAGLTEVRRVMLWAGSEQRLEKGVALVKPTGRGDGELSALLPAGALPGRYRVVLQGSESTYFSDSYIVVRDRPTSPTPPRVVRVDGAVYSDVPGRLYVAGSNMGTVTAVQLKGQTTAELTRIRAYSGARLGATLAAGELSPGSYMLRLKNPHGWANGPTVTVTKSGFAAEANQNFAIYFGVLGAVFLIGLVLAIKQGDVGLSHAAGRRNLVLLLSGFVFTAVLLGSVQFWLAWWS